MLGPRSAPTVGDLVTEWRPDVLTLAVLALLAVGYLYGRRALRTAGHPWPVARDWLFGTGVVLAAWVTSGFAGARAAQLMWVFTAQQLALLLVVPVVLMAAQPLKMARTVLGPRTLPARVLKSRPLRLLGHPTLGMLYVPIVATLLFFGGVGSWAVRSAPALDGLHLALLALGAVIALPLVDVDDRRTSLAVGLAVAIGGVELLVDAIPGIVLRLETHVMMPPFAVARPPWSPSWLGDQHVAGAILWTVAELLDMPFLVLMIRQWIRVERREATRIDAELDRAELDRAEDARRTLPVPAGASPALPDATRPWWLDDPELRSRFGRGS